MWRGLGGGDAEDDSCPTPMFCKKMHVQGVQRLLQVRVGAL